MIPYRITTFALLALACSLQLGCKGTGGIVVGPELGVDESGTNEIVTSRDTNDEPGDSVVDPGPETTHARDTHVPDLDTSPSDSLVDSADLDTVQEVTVPTDTCTPNCACRDCGTDGCGGTCGTCPEFDECSTAACVNGRCHYSKLDAAGCCMEDEDCEDGNPCTLHLCDGFTCRTGLVEVPCCHLDGDCGPSTSCEAVWCDQETHECIRQLHPASVQAANGVHCCEGHTDCGPGGVWEEDGDGDGLPGPDVPGTVDVCDLGLCRHLPAPDGCECGEGIGCPDDGIPCTNEVCIFDCACVSVEGSQCCSTDYDCADGSVCTENSCEDGLCHNFPTANCCAHSADCSEKPCKLTHCLLGQCIFEALPPDTCCQSHEDCDTCDPCTEEYCLNNKCETIPVECE